jgi:hypothetical protein
MDAALDADALARLSAHRLVEVRAGGELDEIRLTERGRFLGGAVTAELVAF